MYLRLLLISALLLPGVSFAIEPGDWVLSRWQGNQYWFPGIVQRVEGSRVTVAYDDGTSETRPIRQVKHYDWTIGSRVECRWRAGNAWYPGRIVAIRGSSGTELRVFYEDGDREEISTSLCRSL
jgi:hypothetical protein